MSPTRREFIEGLAGVALPGLVSARTRGGSQAPTGGTVVTPTYSPASGPIFTGPQYVTISSANATSIYYTLDGTQPSNTNGTLYSTPVLISSNQTLKAKGYANGLTASYVQSGAYAIGTHVNYVGGNVNSIDYYSTELPFLNILKSGGGNGYLQTSGWTTTASTTGSSTNEEGWLQVDSDGYATSLVAGNGFSGTQVFNQIYTLLNYNLILGNGATYPYGYANIVYRLQFTGTGSITISKDPTSGTGTGFEGLTLTNSGTGTVSMTFTIPTPLYGIALTITSIGASSYPHNISVVDNSQASNFDAGAIFNPALLSSLAPYSRIRFLNWLNTNGQTGQGGLYFPNTVAAGATSAPLNENWNMPSGTYPSIFGNLNTDTLQFLNATYTYGSETVTFSAPLAHQISVAYTNVYTQAYSSWSTRPLESNCFWSCIQGCPYEVCIALCNQLGIDCWLLIPMWANTQSGNQGFWTSLATLVSETLNSNLRCYYEFSNEIWNTGFTQAGYAYLIGSSIYTGQSRSNASQEWQGTQVAQMADAIYAVYGLSQFQNQVTVSMGAFTYGASALNIAMNTPDWTSAAYTHHIGGFHVGFYFDNDPSNADCSTILETGSPINTLYGLAYTNVFGGTTYASIGAGGMVGQIVSDLSSTFASLSGAWAPGGASPVSIFGYEGGTGFTNNSVSGWQALYESYIRDSRMRYIYNDPSHQFSTNNGILLELAAIGMTNVNQFSTCDDASANWGALESVQQSISPLSSAPPKYQGIAYYAAGTT